LQEGILVAAGAVLSVAGSLALGGCGRLPDDPATRLLRQLPAEQALYFYVDVAGLRNAPSLAPVLLENAVLPAEIQELAGVTGVDYLADADAVAVSLGTKGTHLAVRGRFDEARLKEAMESTGAVCSQPLRSSPCTIEPRGSRPSLSVLLRAEDLLRASVGNSIGEAGADGAAFQKLLVQARERLEGGALLWATFEPHRTELALGRSAGSLAKLGLFARALQKADRGYLYAEELPGGELQIQLQADCADEGQAASVSNLLTGLNRLATTALEAGNRDEPPPGVSALRGARIASTASKVVAVWVLDERTLRAWGGIG
jgi:hypothetical protein